MKTPVKSLKRKVPPRPKVPPKIAPALDPVFAQPFPMVPAAPPEAPSYPAVHELYPWMAPKLPIAPGPPVTLPKVQGWPTK